MFPWRAAVGTTGREAGFRGRLTATGACWKTGVSAEVVLLWDQHWGLDTGILSGTVSERMRRRLHSGRDFRGHLAQLPTEAQRAGGPVHGHLAGERNTRGRLEPCVWLGLGVSPQKPI